MGEKDEYIFDDPYDLSYLTEEKTPAHKKDRYIKDTKTRSRLAYGVSVFVGVYIISIVFLVYMRNAKDKLNDYVLITFLSTTTVNILGLMYIVLKGLFRAKR